MPCGLARVPSSSAPVIPFMPLTDPIRLVVFDCDGTLVDSQHNIIRAMTAAFESRAMPAPSPEAVRRIVGLSLPQAMAELRPDLEADGHMDLVDAYRESYTHLRENALLEEVLFPGVCGVLDSLEAAGFVLGIATGKSLRGMHATIERHNLDGRFVTVQTADLAPSKPHPGMLRQAMAEAGAEPGQTLLVGDTTYDMEMAVNAGVAAVGVSWGYHPVEELWSAGARHVIEDFSNLPQLAETLMA